MFLADVANGVHVAEDVFQERRTLERGQGLGRLLGRDGGFFRPFPPAFRQDRLQFLNDLVYDFYSSVAVRGEFYNLN